MIKGLGIDMVFVNRIEQAAKKLRFLERCFSLEEIMVYRERGESAQFLAGNFAAKEAVVKALGIGFMGFWPRDIEVLRDTAGRPFVNLLGNAKKAANEIAVTVIHVSITNTTEMASAVAVIEGEVVNPLATIMGRP